MKTRGSPGLAGHQPSSRFGERLCLKGIKQNMMEQDTHTHTHTAQSPCSLSLSFYSPYYQVLVTNISFVSYETLKKKKESHESEG